MTVVHKIINEIVLMPLESQLYIIEQVSKKLREQKSSKEEENNQMKAAANLLLNDYKNDEELTAFTVLDTEEFYDYE